MRRAAVLWTGVPGHCQGLDRMPSAPEGTGFLGAGNAGCRALPSERGWHMRRLIRMGLCRVMWWHRQSLSCSLQWGGFSQGKIQNLQSRLHGASPAAQPAGNEQCVQVSVTFAELPAPTCQRIR